MSKGPTSTKPFQESCYYNLKLSKKDWCIYFKHCPMEKNIPGSYCWVCKYCKKIDVPHLLAERGRDENNICTAVSHPK